MPKSDLILALTKLLVAAAWADGEVSHDEINALKDLLFQIPDLTARDWAALEIYIDSPIDQAEMDRLVSELQSTILTSQDKTLASDTLKTLIHADGIVTPEESAVAQKIQSVIDDVNVNIFGQMGTLMRSSMRRRSNVVSQAPNRELFLEDFLRNRIYYQMRRRLDRNDVEIDLPEEELRKLSLAGGLLSRVAHADEDVSDDEFAAIVKGLQSRWNLSDQAATLVAETALATFDQGLDFYRLSREFFSATSAAERVDFLQALFVVAASDGDLSHEEIEEIRLIARGLKLTHKQFINAKLQSQT
ncbi:MAG: hypothetical protein GTO14_13250 [Anaerolineales bacterium]|nr:hypothetical protein [Anaerolineales bacterium]